MNDSWRNELITKGAAFDALTEVESHYEFEDGHDHLMRWAKTKVFALPSAQPEPAIPLSWIEGQIEWLKSLDNAFSTLTAGQILAMMNKWKNEQNG